MTTFVCDTVACTLRRGVVVKRTIIHKRKIILMSIENTMGSGAVAVTSAAVAMVVVAAAAVNPSPL